MKTHVIMVPALAEREADINEYGELGLKLREAFGQHWLADEDGDVSRALSRARHHFIEERA